MARAGMALLLLCVAATACAAPMSAYQTSTTIGEQEYRAAMAAERGRCSSGDCERACQERGDGAGCALAAELFWSGKYGYPFDPVRSLRYATRGCDSGHRRACSLLGEHHARGVATAIAPERAVPAFTKACDAGDGWGCAGLAELYYQGHGVGIDVAVARRYDERAQAHWRAACFKDDPRACLKVSASAGEDSQTVKDQAAALRERRACSQQVSTACLLVILRSGGYSIPIAVARAAAEELCHQGEPEACVVLANSDRDRDRRRYFFQQACAYGSESACVRAAMAESFGKRGDQATKRRYYGYACGRGVSDACLYAALDAWLASGRDAEVVLLAGRACHLAEPAGCDMLQRFHADRRDDAAADLWALEGCRHGSNYGCARIVAQERALPPLPPGMTKRLYADACVEPELPACKRLTELERKEADVLRALQRTITTHDVAAFARLASDAISVRGLWFDSADCVADFGGDRTVRAKDYRALLACLATLGVRVEPDASSLRTAALVYEPGVALSVVVHDGMIVAMDSTPPATTETVTDVRYITPQALASHLIAGGRTVEPDRQVREAVASASDSVVVAPLHVCVDTTGSMEHAKVVYGGAWQPNHGGYSRAVEDAAAGWRFRPFEIGGVPVRVCALDVFVYPPERWRRAGSKRSTTSSSAPPRTVTSQAFEAHRIGGNRHIVPDEGTQMRIGSARLIGTFRVCIAIDGTVSTVGMLKSTEFPEYDRLLDQEIRTWQYRPFWGSEGQPVPACTAVTFIYNQR